MKSSIQHLQKFFKLEAERGYDNHAVMGGLERILDWWEAEARADGLPEDLISVIEARIRDYGRLTQKSRSETLQGLWRRIQRGETDIPAEEKIDAGLPKSEPRPPLPEPPATPQPPPSVDRSMEIKPAEKLEAIESSEPVHQLEERPAPILSSVPTNLPPAVAPEALSVSLSVIQGVGPKLASLLQRLGLNTIRDALYFFPRRYVDYTRLLPINRLVYGEDVTVIATVQNVAVRTLPQRRMQIVEAILGDGAGAMRATWFNQPWVAKRLQSGMQISISGKVTQYLGRPVMDNPSWGACRRRTIINQPHRADLSIH